MSSIQNTSFLRCLITPENDIKFTRNGSDGQEEKNVDSLNIVNSVITFDYFEDILSPAISVHLKISNTSALYSQIPIRGYERIDMEIQTDYGTIEFNDKKNNPLYVVGIEGLTQTEGQEIFTLKLCTLTNLSNEVTRCQKRYEKKPISEHVKDILEDVLKADNNRVKVEDSITSYGFIGNNRKPFYTITWLAAKAVPSTQGAKGVSGSGETAEGKGTAGFFFYEDYDGFKFKSVDRMVDATNVDYPKDTTQKSLKDDYGIYTYTYSNVITEGSPESENQILHHFTDKTTNLHKNLRVGLYSNLTYTYNPLNWGVKAVKYDLKDQIDAGAAPTAGETVPIPQGDITNYSSRVMARVGDTGMWAPDLEKNDDGEVEDSGRDPVDMAKAFTRYTLLYQQSLNITIPCNIKLRVGNVIKLVFPEVGPAERQSPVSKKADQELSGFYIIRSLRHHFEISEGKNVTSLNLIRDSYGLK